MLPMMPHPLDPHTARRTSYEDSYYFDEDRCGLELTEHEITIEKPVENSILGLTLSGGIPVCPFVYISHLTKDSLASESGLQLGDEISGINNVDISFRLRRKDVKEIIESEIKLVLSVRRIVVDHDVVAKKSASLEMKYQKMKHKFIEKHLEDSTADAIGFTRAILANDLAQDHIVWVKSKQEFLTGFKLKLDDLIGFYQNQADTYLTLSEACSTAFSNKNNKDNSPTSDPPDEPLTVKLPKTNKTLNHGILDAHSKHAQTAKGLNFCRNKLIEFEQTKLATTVQILEIYEHDKYEFLSFFLKMKEMEEEENDAIYNNIPCWRLESGNYDYRMFLKAKVLLKDKFKKSRTAFIENVDQLKKDYKKVFYDIVCLEYCAVMNRFHESLQGSGSFIERFVGENGPVMVSRDESIESAGHVDQFEKYFPKEEPSLIQF